MRDEPAEVEARRSTPPEDDLTLQELLALIRRRWRLTLLAVVVFTLLGALYTVVATPTYRASMIVGAVPTPGGGPSPASPGIGGMAALSFLNIAPTESVSPYRQFLELYGDPAVMERVAAKHPVLPAVFSDQWDAESGGWRRPSGILSQGVGWIRRLRGLPEWTPPDAFDLASYVSRHVSTSTVGATELRRMSFSHADPEFARTLLTWIHQEADDLIKQINLKRAEGYVGYVQLKLREVQISEYRRLLTDILATQEQMLMIAAADLPYAAQVLKPPLTDPAPSWPRPALILLVAAAAGLVTGLIVSTILGLRSVRSFDGSSGSRDSKSNKAA